MRKIFLSFILLCLPILANAAEGDEVVEVDGILFTLDHENMEAGVCNRTYPDMYSGDIVIPSSIMYGGNTYSVTRIEDWAFGPSYITSIIISEGVKVIGKKAFTSCYYLTSITLPKSLTTIRQLAFSGCDKLTSITIPDSVTCIEFGAFAHCI